MYKVHWCMFLKHRKYHQLNTTLCTTDILQLYAQIDKTIKAVFNNLRIELNSKLRNWSAGPCLCCLNDGHNGSKTPDRINPNILNQPLS